MTTGKLSAKNPYIHHSTCPNARVANILFDTASVRPSRQHLRTCGTKLHVDKQPATRPTRVGRELASISQGYPVATAFWARSLRIRIAPLRAKLTPLNTMIGKRPIMTPCTIHKAKAPVEMRYVRLEIASVSVKRH